MIFNNAVVMQAYFASLLVSHLRDGIYNFDTETNVLKFRASIPNNKMYFKTLNRIFLFKQNT